MVAMSKSFTRRLPTLTEAARLMGTSHQDVKQIALKLAEKDFLVLEKNFTLIYNSTLNSEEPF